MLKDGMKVEMIENCIDNHNIKEGWTGTIDYIAHDGIISVEFDHFVSGNGISSNNKNAYQWYVHPKYLREVI